MCVSGVRFIFYATLDGSRCPRAVVYALLHRHLRTKVLCSDGSRCHLLIKPFEPWS